MSGKRRKRRIEISDVETFHDGEMGICAKCGRKIVLPCLACRIEAVAEKREERDDFQNEDRDFLRIDLKTKAQRRRYREVRDFRDRYDKSMYDPEEPE